MTVLLSDRDAPDSEDFVVCWLQPLLRAAIERKTGDPLPFALVQTISAIDDPDSGVDDEVVQVDFFDEARGGVPAAVNAKTAARQGHQRLMRLARFIDPVVMSDGSTAHCDYLNTVMRPVYMEYGDDQIARYVGRYQLGLSYVDI